MTEEQKRILKEVYTDEAHQEFMEAMDSGDNARIMEAIGKQKEGMERVMAAFGILKETDPVKIYQKRARIYKKITGKDYPYPAPEA